MHKRTCTLTALGLLAIAALSASADDWAQFRGPQRNGVSTETNWTSTWPTSGPKKLWSQEIGDGYATTLVANRRVYALGSTPEKDTVYCLDAQTGAIVWKYPFDHGKRAYTPDQYPNALTATPLLQGGQLYVLGREGKLLCFDVKKGKVLWDIDLFQVTGATKPMFGVSSSPIIEGDLLLFNVGIGGAALNKNTGKVVWKTAGMGGYASPVVYIRNGKREAAFFSGATVVGVEATTGKQLWEFPVQGKAFAAASGDPILYGDSLFVCTGQKGGSLLKLEGTTPTTVWQCRDFASDFTNPVLLGGYLYGNSRNKLTCLDIKTGEVRWQEPGLGQGSLIAAGGKLILLTERGDLIVAAATPEKYTELSRTKLFEGNGFFASAGYIAPTLANGRLYCRMMHGPLVCLDLRSK